NLPMDGIIEYVYLYRRAFSTSEIAQLYRTPFMSFQQEPPMTYMGSVAAAPSVGQVIIISSVPPLLFIGGCVLLFRKVA
ncbi:hypothetical protein LCGC14_1617390, partial [marine sediment metagenome]